ncbi:uncharacterized protein LOC111792861 isoform X1 [Cucurbita pepo subsp. pepo]|uniref:uncharacterized protein LOC111792861 isoform X1 n=2 Tax=Cucurbita pepo subsp. pepo TaxID=3664 RepID=UPI000C9D6F61|nr:uncharacterized protein LOC111792861 isoform X1 [Cucurbita pepo subsp. pepo]
MASPLPSHLHYNSSLSTLIPNLHWTRCIQLSRSRAKFSGKARVLAFRVNPRGRRGVSSFRCFSSTGTEVQNLSRLEESERPPFDINLAVILAGFAFEAYTSPSENFGKREVDAAGCETVFLSESFVREIYDGQLFIKLKKGIDFPAMDLWGTSDPYVVFQLDGQVVKSKTKWGTKQPTWNQDFTLNVKDPSSKYIQVAAWDANLVTPHKRMGNAGINLESLCDGDLHDVSVELEGMGGGGKLLLEIKFMTFDEIEDDKRWWRVPFISEFLRSNGFASALNKVVGSDTVSVGQFVEYAFGKLKSFNDEYQSSDNLLSKQKDKEDIPSYMQTNAEVSITDISDPEEDESDDDATNDNTKETGQLLKEVTQSILAKQFDKHFWTNLADVTNQNIVKKLGLPAPEKLKWDGFELLNKIGLEARKSAEAGYIESGLATSKSLDVDQEQKNIKMDSTLTDVKKITKDLLSQTESVLGGLMVLTATISQLNKESQIGKKDTEDEGSKKVGEKLGSSGDGSLLDNRNSEEMRALFASAESAMEAWAMLATSLGHPSFIKSEFEKLCFLDNESTDTQVAIWRDFRRRRLVVAFRGTEQSRWKDLRTDLMLAPAGLNPERISGDFNEEIQVHSGFLSAYDSVRMRIMSLIKMAINCSDDCAEPPVKWHVYVTGHSLGGALATLLALELTSSQLARHGAINVTMYNFGSPRVGNRQFAEIYNKKVKDSWRVVNHRDIVPTVPHLMGYCHVAQPVYLAAGDLNDALENMELHADGYLGDVIGESTPDVLVNEFLRGEKELVEKVLNTEINIFRSIRDGSALMQHMEDFYYITLLENVRSNYQNDGPDLEA